MKVKKLHPNAKLPVRAESGSNGYDLFASEDVFVSIGETTIVPTGISIELEKTISGRLPVFKIEDRSSMAAKGLRTGAGIVDFSYRGEIKVVIHNLWADNRTKEQIFARKATGYQINKGDKIAQGLIYLTSVEDVEEVRDLSETERNGNGFGSSGL